jgi:hypothetical protein
LNWQKWLENWDMTELNISAGFLNMQWKPQDGDRDAAWDLYIELLTRITTQPLANEEGIEQAALDSVYSLFPTTRAIIREHGRNCAEFTKIAIVVLNQIVRPFTAEWHRQSMEGAFDNSRKCAEFRRELEIVQGKLIRYTRMLGEMAGVERDLTRLED